MTNREFYNAIINGDINDDVLAMAKAEIEKLDNRNAKRRNTPTKEQKENEGHKQSILEALVDKPLLASEIATATGLSTQKVSALGKLLEKDGKVTITDVKVKGKGTLKQYALVVE